MSKNILIVAMAFLLSACDFLNTSKPLYGKWQCVNWTVDGDMGKYDIANTNFEFKDNDTYSSSISKNLQNGTYFVEEGYLHTTADGDAKIMTKIETVNSDSLILSMNRGGILEVMTFIKQK